MALTKVLITVKTYPTLSARYDELVCTAGFREDGSWIRIYPVPFRQKSYTEQYKKYDWIEVDLVKNDRDFRPESYRPVTIDSEIKVVGHISTHENWEERKRLCLGKIYHNLTELIQEAKDKLICTSLAVFKPAEIIDFVAEPVARDWDRRKMEKLNQLKIFEPDSKGGFDVVRKLPYKFKYIFRDIQGVESRMMIEDWETGQLFWNSLARHKGDEGRAIADVRKRYFDDFVHSKDLYFFMGTTKLYHFTAPNPFVIIGAFYPKKLLQAKLF